MVLQRDLKTETALSMSLNRIKVIQQELYYDPKHALDLIQSVIDDLNVSYVNIVKTLGKK